jgi:hypothetical protein
MKCLYPVDKKRVINGSTMDYQHRCGQCINCRITRRKEWTCRILLEAKHHLNKNSFITLTYDEENLPYEGVTKDESQRFIKRLRRKFSTRFRYFIVGEYGDIGGRPHYHAVLFGLPPVDYVYDRINEAWGKGIIDVTELNQNRAQYVAGYVTKKYTATTGAPQGCGKEFSLMSRNPGIGLGFTGRIVEELEKFGIRMVTNGNVRSSKVKGLMFGRRILPLDRYMQLKIMEQLGQETSEVQMGLLANVRSIQELRKDPEVKAEEHRRLQTKARKYLKLKRKRDLSGAQRAR